MPAKVGKKMTQTKIDIDHAEAPELIQALAKKPCPCPGHKIYMHHSPCLDIEAGHGKLLCGGDGLANPWASSEVCPYCGGEGAEYGNCEDCNDSGRAPKDVGLLELVERFPNEVIGALEHEYVVCDEGPDFMLAALRAVVLSGQNQ